jgi:CheY-like chemotaxis protein
MSEAPNKRSQFLFVDDEPEFLNALTGVLREISKGQWAFRTATNHSQALEQMKAQPVEVVVLDFAMPVMNGVEFLRLLRQTHPGQRVVMLSGQMDEAARKSAVELGASLCLDKPSTPEGFQGLFSALEALVSSGPQAGFRGVMQVGLQEVLQMECLARKSSILVVSTGNRRGQIFICDGSIIHAEWGKMQGEVALYGLLGLTGGEFTLHPFTEPPQRTISGQHEFLLMEAARLNDENGSQPVRPGSLGDGEQQGAPGETQAATEARGVRIEEVLLCSSAGEVLYQWKCESLEARLDLFKKLEEQASEASKGTPSGRFHRVSMDTGASRLQLQIQPTFRLLVRSALPGNPINQ